MQIVYLGEIRRQFRNRLHGGSHVENYEPGRTTYYERLVESEWTLEDFVVGERDENLNHPTVIGFLDGELTFDYHRIRWAMLQTLETVVGLWSPDSVTEVGAGTGRNLVWLAEQLSIRCRGVELTAAGAAAGNLAAARFGLDVEMSQGDITSPATSIPAADVVLSVHALEQIPEPREVIQRMVSAARKAVIMVEPFPEFWPSGLGRVAHRMRANYLGRLRKGALTGLDYRAEPLQFGTALNRATVVTIPAEG